jgi:GTP:adenosylcobinamide-phosphate guanylyltransferase
MDAIVTAGGIPQPGEPLYEYTLGASKAMLDIAGKPMIQWVIDALEGAETIDGIVIIGLPAESEIVSSKEIARIPNQGGMVDNIRTGVNKVLELKPGVKHALLVSSDIPTISAEMVDWVVNTALESDHEAYYNVISREVMEKRFPGSKRSYTRLRGMEICGGDMNLIKTSLVTQNVELWNKLVAARKNVFKQAALIGYDTLFLLFFRLVDLDGAVKKATKRLHLTGRAIVCPYAEVGMDVDKPHQLELVRADLSRNNPS